MESVIVKLMPSGRYDVTAGTFAQDIAVKVAAIPGHTSRSIIPLVSTRFTYNGKGKEADAAFKCNTQIGEGLWPNLVIEVGYSESLARLRLDAQWWLQGGNENVKMVILVQVGKSPDFMHLELWAIAPYTGLTTRHSRNSIPQCVSITDIDANGIVSPLNILLIIPYNSIFDNSNPNGSDLIFTPNELSAIALSVFQNS
jgi:hypothetical protein